MKLDLVSVIIPFHNAADYLHTCVASVIGQTYREVEILLVDDGSTDISAEMGVQYAAKHDNVILRKTENLGPGNARNTGIYLANGEFVVFVDSDDYLAPTMVEKMVMAIKDHDADIVLCKFELFNEETAYVYEKVWDITKNCIEGSDAVRGMYEGKVTFTVWGKIFKRIDLEKMRFPIQVIFEDRIFMLKVFLQAKKICFIDEVLTHVRMRKNSLTRAIISSKRIEDLTKIYLMELAYAEKRNLKWLVPFLNTYHLSALRNTFFLLEKHEKVDKSLILLRPVLMKHIQEFYRTAFSKLSFKNKIHLQLLRSSNRVGWKMGRLIMRAIYTK